MSDVLLLYACLFSRLSIIWVLLVSIDRPWSCSNRPRNADCRVVILSMPTKRMGDRAMPPIGWAYSLVNDRKFSAETVFFSHTKPASSTFSRSSNEQAQPNKQAVRPRSVIQKRLLETILAEMVPNLYNLGQLERFIGPIHRSNPP